MKIKAAIVPSQGEPFQIAEVELEEPRVDEILVRMVGTGVCHSDIVFRDVFPASTSSVLGHEGAGIVEQVGKDVTSVKPGDHVVLSFNYCCHCNNCLKGRPYYCDKFMLMNYLGKRVDGSATLSMDGTSLHGSFHGQSSFATYALASEKNTVKVPDDVPLEILGPLGCGIQTGAGTVMNALKAPAGSTMAVFGMGTVGLSAVMAAKVVGCSTIIAVDINPERLKLAQVFGATHVLDSREVNPAIEIQGITGYGSDYAIEAAGNPGAYRQAVEGLNPTGTCILLGLSPLGTEVTFDMNLFVTGRTTKGILEGESIPHLFIPTMINMYKKGIFPFDKLMKFYPLEEINKAVEDSARGISIKPVIRF
ncbi:MAG: NAD(P)-dependent alcohol dehydrogenase [bacterium]|nr:NAD(P)-dependent alcohol dehydrogenase [bacterium]